MVRPGAGCPWGRGGGGEFPWEFSSATLALCPPPPACMPASTSPNWDMQQGVFAAFAKDGEELWLLWWHAEAHNRV